MKRFCFLLALLISPIVLAEGPGEDEPVLTGRLGYDVLYSAQQVAPLYRVPKATTPRRVIPLAAGMSLLLPGTGQIYNRSWIKSVVLIGIETAVVTGYFSWRNRGREGEEVFIAYAHQSWSPIRYAQWLSGYSGYGGEPIPLPSLTQAQFQQPDAWSDAQRQEVRSFFTAIRRAEEQSIHVETGAAFSHVLPYFAEQQYYELIGKYFQYAPGWSDYNGADDPEESAPDGSKVNVPRDSQFYDYAAVHADANDWFRRASRLSGVLLLNHFLAAIDAAVTAKLHNDRLQTRVSVVPTNEGEFVAQAELRIRL